MIRGHKAIVENGNFRYIKFVSVEACTDQDHLLTKK